MKAREILKKLVEEKVVGVESDLDNTLRRKVLRAFSKINELIGKEDLHVVETEEDIEETPDGMLFSPARLSLTVCHQRHLVSWREFLD